MEAVEALRACYAFENVPDRQIRELALLSEARSFTPGEILIRQFEKSSHLFVILEGEAATRGLKGEPIARFGPGTIVGEIALIDGEPRSATVAATSDLKVAQIYAPPVMAMMDNDPRLGYTIAANLARLLCQRLRNSNQYIDGLSAKTA
ncbi:hypothetical protein BH11ARM2_BH11ARM2_25990 [soil metagenome]